MIKEKDLDYIRFLVEFKSNSRECKGFVQFLTDRINKVCGRVKITTYDDVFEHLKHSGYLLDFLTQIGFHSMEEYNATKLKSNFDEVVNELFKDL